MPFDLTSSLLQIIHINTDLTYLTLSTRIKLTQYRHIIENASASSPHSNDHLRQLL